MELKCHSEECRDNGTASRVEAARNTERRPRAIPRTCSRLISAVGLILLAATHITARLSATTTPFSLVVQEGDPAPSVVGGTYSRIVSASIDDSGAITFSANLAESTIDCGIFIESGGTTQVLVKAGDAAPGGGTFANFLEVDRAYAVTATPPFAYLLFHATLQGTAATEGIFVVAPDGSIQAIALTGGISPFGFHYQSFSSPSLVTLPIGTGAPFNSSTYYAGFVAQMTENCQSIIIFAYGAGSEFTTAPSGFLIGKTPPTGFAISRAGSDGTLQASLGSVMNFPSSPGKPVQRVVLFIGGGAEPEGLSYTGRIGAGVPGGTVKEVLSPPAISSQTIVMVIALKGLPNVLASSRAFSGLSPIQSVGDPAPGLHGFKIKSFGPPVANDGQAQPLGPPILPQAFASLVGLTHDAQGILTIVVPVSGEPQHNVVLLPRGADASGQSVTPTNISLIKLNNNGTLLFSGSVGAAGSQHLALFQMAGLFDGAAPRAVANVEKSHALER